MRVQRVRMPDSRAESWTVLGDDHCPVDLVERFLAYLASIERSPNTVKAYAHDLKDCSRSSAGGAWTGGRSRSRTSPRMWPGVGCHPRLVTVACRCCRRWRITAVSRA
jgi:hypothetical protein